MSSKIATLSNALGRKEQQEFEFHLVEHSPFEEPSRVAVASVDRVDGVVVPLDPVDHRNGQRSSEK